MHHRTAQSDSDDGAEASGSGEAPAPDEAPPPEGTPADDGTGGDAELTPEELAMLAEQEAQAEAEVIVVTGSAIERKELTTPAPVSVIDKADIDAAGLPSVGDILQNLPSQSNAINVQANNGGDGSTRVDIRGLGTARTLVLLNGRRVVPGGTGADASVDLNAIPLAVIERLEVLKDGASAVYGSDAIGGVVNIITRDDFEGQEANLYTGTSQRGDGQVYDVSFITGTNGKKSNVVFAAGYTEQKAVWAGDRGYSVYDHYIDDLTICKKGQFGVTKDGENYIAGPDYEVGTADDRTGCALANGGSSAIPKGRLSYNQGDIDNGNQAFQDEVVANCPSGFCTRDDATGQWRDFRWTDEDVPGQPNDFYNYQPENYLYTPSQRYNMFSTGHYEVASHARVFFEGMYNHRFSRQQLAAEPIGLSGEVFISKDSIYNPYGIDIFRYRRRMKETGDRFFQQNVDSFRGVMGVEGDMPDDSPLKTWKWEVSFNYGKTLAQQDTHGSLISSHLTNMTGPSFRDADGNAFCGTPDAVIDGCTPLDLLSGYTEGDTLTSDQKKYLTFTGVTAGYNEQKTLLATAHGQIIKIGDGGDISAAVGADYRNEAGAYTPDPLTATGDTTGNAVEPTSGSYNVSEGFAELSAVPIVGKPGLDWVEVDAAVRGFHYNRFGNGLTWKAGGLVRTVGGVSIRGTYSTAFRAPSIGELFSGQADDFPAANDPCDTGPNGSNGPLPAGYTRDECIREGLDPDNFQNDQNQIRTRVGGNPKLGREKANTMTAGLVFEPKAVKGLSLTLDYFNVDITDAVQSYGVGLILSGCYNAAPGPDQEAQCAKVHRSAAGQIDSVDDLLSNVGGNSTSGIDAAVNYRLETSKAGTFTQTLEGTYLIAFDLKRPDGNTVHGRGVYDLGVYPYFKANFNEAWARGPVGAGLNVRYIGSYTECEDLASGAADCRSHEIDPTSLWNPHRTVDANITADLWASYQIKTAAGTTVASVGVNNLTDQNPPYLDTGFLADSDASTYDYLGRYFYLRLTQDF